MGYATFYVCLEEHVSTGTVPNPDDSGKDAYKTRITMLTSIK